MKEYTKDSAAATDVVNYANEAKDVYQFSQGLLFEIDGTTTTVKRIDFWNSESAGSDWIIDASKGTAGFQYTDAKLKAASTAATFANEKVEVEWLSKTSLRLKLNAATYANDNNSVHRYTVYVYQGGALKKTVYFRSYRYLGKDHMPKELEFDVTGLTEGKDYDFKIVAEDSMGKQSDWICGSTYGYQYDI